MAASIKKFLPLAILAVIGIAAYVIWQSGKDDGPGEGFAGGNGRIEATEIDVSAKLAGRVEEILVNEGDFVEEGQVLARMQTDVLEAQLNEAKAQRQQMISARIQADSQIALRESDKVSAEATVAQRLSELDQAQRKLSRSSVLVPRGSMAAQELDDDETRMHGAKAAVAAARAQVTVAEAAVDAARAEAEGAAFNVMAATATVSRIQADIDDSMLRAPRSGRIQYRIAQPGEVLAAGGKVLNLVDLSDVYMTFFLPEQEAGRVKMGSEARIVLDAYPDSPVPASITYVASTAQFTPKTVETEEERQKLMFRVKAQISPELLRQHLEQVKVGLPGVAWIKTDQNVEWPENLRVREYGGSGTPAALPANARSARQEGASPAEPAAVNE